MFSRVVTSIAMLAEIELPIRLTFILLFPFMGFFPPPIAIICGRRIGEVRLSLVACFTPIIVGELIYLIFLGVILFVPWLELAKILLLAISLGLIGVGAARTTERMTYKLGVALIGTGSILWLFALSEGISRWLIMLIGVPM
jgi:hypothetical protein